MKSGIKMNKLNLKGITSRNKNKFFTKSFKLKKPINGF